MHLAGCYTIVAHMHAAAPRMFEPPQLQPVGYVHSYTTAPLHPH
jgi:hypothetical protein